MSVNIYKSEKQKWLSEYKTLIQNFKNEELSLLKLFLEKNYHLNKVYKKYAYKEKIGKYNFIEDQKKIQYLLKDKKNKEKIKNLIEEIKTEFNKEHIMLIKEENKIENELKKYDNNLMMIYDNDFDEWIKDNKSIIIDYTNNNSDFDNKDNISLSLNEQKHIYSTNYNSKNYEADFDYIKNSDISSINNDDKLNNLKYISNDSTTEMMLSKNEENPIKNYLEKINKEINYIYMPNNQINQISQNIKENIIFNNNNKDINNIKIYLNKINEDSNTSYYLNEEIKNINNIIKDDLGGIYLGWNESEHKEFIKLKKEFKEKINSFLFLSNLNNLFPYMTISKLKKHIKLYEIYLKIEKVKNLLVEKYNSIKNIINNNKSKSAKKLNISISVTKSFNSKKINNFNIKKNNMRDPEKKRSSKTINIINNKGKYNRVKIQRDYLKKDYLKIGLKYRTKENFFLKDFKKNVFNNYSINIIKRRSFNNFFNSKK